MEGCGEVWFMSIHTQWKLQRMQEPISLLIDSISQMR